MKSVRQLFLVLFLCPMFWLTSHTLQAQDGRAWSVNSLPMPHLQDSNRYTVNPDGILSNNVVDEIDDACKRLDDSLGVEMVCVIVGKVAGDDVYTFGDSLFTKYGFGKKEADTGVLIVVSTVGRDWRIFTGKGMEGTLPDVVCNRIGNKFMVPLLKEGKWDEAMLSGATAVVGVVKGDPEFEAVTNFDEESDDDLGGALGVIGGVGLLVGAAAYFGRKRCPKCRAFMKVKQRRLVSYIGTVKTYYVTYECPKCGHTFTTTERVDLASQAVAAGSILSGTRGGGGGGFSGGSFGGGSFGGGGAGGKF